jgi:hypothetical protein
MTQHTQADAGDNTKPAAQATDNTTVQQKLFDDLNGKFFPGNSKQENVATLVKDGILPAGSTVIDMGAVKGHLADDQKKLADLNGKQPTDAAPATKTLGDAQGVQTKAQQDLDAADAKVKPVADRIDARTKQDAQVKADFDTVSKASGKDSVNKEDLTKLSTDQSKTQAVRDAASHLLGTFQDHVTKVGGRGGPHDVHSTTDDYGDKHWYSNNVYLDKNTIAAGAAKHATENAADQKTLAPLAAEQNKAKAAKADADKGVDTAQKGLDTVQKDNKDLADQKTQTTARIKEEQDALTPDGSIDKAGRVVKGGGYYQVAENLLGVSDKGRHTADQEKELKLLTHLLQEEEKALNGGHLPKYLKQNEQLLKPENLQAVMDKLKPAPVEAQPPKRVSADPPPAYETDT